MWPVDIDLLFFCPDSQPDSSATSMPTRQPEDDDVVNDGANTFIEPCRLAKNMHRALR